MNREQMKGIILEVARALDRWESDYTKDADLHLIKDICSVFAPFEENHPLNTGGVGECTAIMESLMASEEPV